MKIRKIANKIEKSKFSKDMLQLNSVANIMF